MPDLGSLVHSSAICYRLKGETKSDILKSLANVAADVYKVDPIAAYEQAMKREMLGGTGIGEGVAVPHARINQSNQSSGVFALLETPVDFEAPDGQPADLVFLLISPEEAGASHLKSLARITRFMRIAENRNMIRNAKSAEAIMAILSGISQSQVA